MGHNHNYEMEHTRSSFTDHDWQGETAGLPALQSCNLHTYILLKYLQFHLPGLPLCEEQHYLICTSGGGNAASES